MEQALQDLGIQGGFSNALAIWALMMSRMLPLLLLAPFIGGDMVPAPVKLATGVAFTVLLYPFLAETRLPTSPVIFVLLMLKEVFIGTAIAFAATMAFDAARAAGTFIDTSAGTNMATVFVPHIQQQASLFADVKFQLAIVIFLGLNGHHLVIYALLSSFQSIPLNGWPHFGHGYWPFFHLIIRMTGDMIILSFALSAPAVMATFITDLTMGLINRVAPQIQVFFISMSIKPISATFLVLVAFTMIYERLVQMFVSMVRHVQDIVILFT